MGALVAIGIPILTVGLFLWALNTLDRIRMEQRELAASVAAMHAKLDELLGRTRTSAPSASEHAD